jgi:hypothetical protein
MAELREFETCALCLSPIFPEINYFTDEAQHNEPVVEVFTHAIGRGSHSFHAECQLNYIQANSRQHSINCMVCRGNLGTPDQCRNAIIAQNRRGWEINVGEIRNSVLSYLPSRRTVVMSGLVLATITAALLAGRAGETRGVAEMVRQIPAPAPVGQVRMNGINPFLFAMSWVIIMGGGNRNDTGPDRRERNLFDPVPTRRRDPRYDAMGRYRGRGGTRRKNKKMLRRRGGAQVKNGIINSPESLLDFLNVIAKLNEKNTEPYYVVLSNVDKKNVISLLNLLKIDVPRIVDAVGYERQLLYDEDESFSIQPPEMLVGQ